MTKHKSIRRKLIRVLFITLATVMVLAFASFYAYEFITFKRDMKRDVSAVARLIAYNASAALAFDNQDEALEVLSSLKGEKHIVSATLYDSAGVAFAEYLREGNESDTILNSGSGYEFIKNRLIGFETVKQGAMQIGSLRIISDLDELYDSLLLYLGISLLIFAVTFFISYILLTRLQASITNPILELAGTAAYVSDKRDYSVRATVNSNDETGLLTKAFNQMLSEIEKQNQKITKFNSELEAKVEERTSELENTNNELLQKNELIETVINSSVDLIAVLDMDFRYRIINKKAIEVYGGTEDRFLGRSMFEIFPKLIGSQMETCLLKAHSGIPAHLPNYHSVVSNKIFENFFIPLHNISGEVRSVLIVGHDMTERIIADEKMKELNRELVQSNRELEQFAYITSHDLQEPLRKIRTYSDLAVKNMSDNAQVEKYLGKVSSAAHRMAALISNILEYSRLSGATFESEPVNLHDVIYSVRNDLEILIEERKAQIKVEDLPEVQGNFSQLCQLFLNLINNAIKFSGKEPVIFISPGHVNDRYVEIAIKDNGIGFEQKFADKIFAPFQRLHGRNEYPGTGIGLAICQRIVNNHEGSIRVDSKPGVGTTFHIKLPLANLN